MEVDRETVIRLAREAWFVVDDESRKHQPLCVFHTHYMVDELLERFATLLMEHYRPKPLTEDEWLDIAEENANCDFDCKDHDGYLNAVKAIGLAAIKQAHGITGDAT